MLDRILTGMRPYFGTTSDIAIVTTAGTGGLEAAVVNVISPGDRVLGVSIGSFGDRFAKIARTYGADVTKIEVEWGQAADPAVVRAELERDQSYKAVLLTHNETSTSVMNPIRGAGRRRPRDRARRAHPRRQRVRPRRRAVRDGRLGRRRRRHRLAEGLDVGARSGDDRRLAARLGSDGDRDRAARLPRPAGPSREPRQRPDAVDAGHRGRLPGRRGHPADDRRGRRARLRPPRGVCRGDPGRADRPRLRAASPTRASRRGPSPARSSPTTSTGRRSTPSSSAAASSWPVARAS